MHITISRHPGGLTARSWLVAARWIGTPRVVVALAASVAVAAGTIGAARLVNDARAAPGFPVRCVSLTIALHDPRFLRVDFDRALPCERAGAPYGSAGTARSQ